MRKKHVSIARKVVRLDDWGVNLSGTQDARSALVAADAEAAASNWVLELPPGKLRVSASVTQTAHWRGVAAPVGHFAPSRTILVAGMTDGTPVVVQAPSASPPSLVDIAFHSQPAASAPNSDPTNAQNAYAIMAGDPDYSTGTEVNHRVAFGLYRNITVTGLLGIKALGWRSVWEGIRFRYCKEGFRGAFLNDAILDLAFEECHQFFMLHGHGMLIRNLYGEATQPGAHNYIAGNGVTIANAYLEDHGARTLPWMRVGYDAAFSTGATTGETQDFKVLGGNIGRVGNFYSGIPSIALDKVDGVDIHVAKGAGRYRLFTRSANTKRVSHRSYNNDRDAHESSAGNRGVYPFVETTAPVQLPVQDLLPNPFCDGLRLGARLFGQARAVVSEDTAIVRTGRRAIRITATEGEHSNYAFVRWYDKAFLDSIRGKFATFGGFFHVPDIAAFKPVNSTTAPTHYPRITIQCRQGDTTLSTAEFTSAMQTVDGWNFMYYGGTVHADTDNIQVLVYVNATTNVAPAGMFLVMDSLHCAQGVCHNELFAGQFVRSPFAIGAVEGGRLTLYKTQAEADEWDSPGASDHQVYEVGDRVLYTDPSAGGEEGLIVTSPGQGGSLAGITGAINDTESTLTVSGLTGIVQGKYITIAGVTGVKKIIGLAGSVATLDSPADATVSGADVAYAAPTFKTFGAVGS